MKKIVLALCAALVLLLQGCAQEIPLKLSLAAGERGTFQATAEGFCKAFNQKTAEAGVEGLEIGELSKGEAGAYTRYTYVFDKQNLLAFDCGRKTGQISAVYLVYAEGGVGSGAKDASGTGKFGSGIPVAIYAAAGRDAEQIKEVLGALGVTTVSSPQNGYYQEYEDDGAHYEMRVEDGRITFAMAAVKPEQ